MNLSMKRIVCLAALACGLLSVPAQAQSRIAVVDLKKVFDGYWRTKQADTQLKERAADFEKARNGLIEDYKKSNEEFRTFVESAQDPALSGGSATSGRRSWRRSKTTSGNRRTASAPSTRTPARRSPSSRVACAKACSATSAGSWMKGPGGRLQSRL